MTTEQAQETYFFFPLFSPGASNGCIQTRELRITSQLFFQHAQLQLAYLKKYFLLTTISIWCQQWLDLNP
jgi:hypothetical protein